MNNNIFLVIRHPVGGIKSYLKYVYESERFKKYNFTILIPCEDSDDFLNVVSTLDFTVKFSKPSTLSLILHTLSELKKNDYSLIHSHGFTSGICVSIATLLSPTRHVMTSHDVLLDKQFRGFLAPFRKYFLTVLFNRIDLIISVSEDARRNFQEMLPGVNKPEHIAILNGISIENYLSSNKRNFRSELNLDESYFIIGFLGRFMSQKGFRDIINAIEILKNEYQMIKKPLVLAFGFGGFIREDRALIEQKGLEDHFMFLPAVEHPGPTIKGLDVLAMPSRWEACGLLAMESLVAGTPLIASNCIGLREVIKDTPAFVVQPENPRELAKAINKCMEENRKTEFESYQQMAVKRFDVNSVSEKVSCIYEKMLT